MAGLPAISHTLRPAPVPGIVTSGRFLQLNPTLFGDARSF